MKKLLLAIWLSVVCSFAVSAKYFAYTPPAKEAFQQATSLRFTEAYYSLARLKNNDPDNLIVYHIENYIDFYHIYVNEDETQFEKLKKNKAPRLEKIRAGNRNSPYYLFVQAEIHLQWALVRFKFGEYLTAFSEASKAYKLLKENQKKYPGFIANKKSLGALHALVGTIPDSYKWGIKLLGGLEGTIEQGKRELEEVLDYAKDHDFIFEEETLMLYAFVLLSLKNNDREAWQILRNSNLDPQHNPLAVHALAYVAMNSGRNEEAIQLLMDRPTGSSFLPFHYLDYLLGLAKLKRLDPDADVYFQRFLKNFKGENYIKEAYQKLAWSQLLQGNRRGYQNYINLCKSKGTSQLEGDKNALREAKTKEQPHPLLLQARLLFDGGYYQRARQLLNKQAASDFSNKKHQLEYTYRSGRIAHKMNDHLTALHSYQQTIDQGRNEVYYFACNAALQMGIIYEKKNQASQAKKYYKLCLSLRPEQYRSGLHQKAKAGLNRLKG